MILVRLLFDDGNTRTYKIYTQRDIDSIEWYISRHPEILHIDVFISSEDKIMITIDNTHGKMIKYEVVITYYELIFRVTFHKYIDARSLFTEIINERILGLTAWLNDLTHLPDC